MSLCVCIRVCVSSSCFPASYALVVLLMDLWCFMCVRRSAFGYGGGGGAETITPKALDVSGGGGCNVANCNSQQDAGMGLRSALPHVFWLHIYIVCVCASGSNSNLVAMASVVQQAVSSCPGRNIVFCSSGGFGACVPSPSSHASPLSPMCARDPLFCVTHTAFSFYRVSRAKSRIGLRNRFAVLFNRTRFTLSCSPAVLKCACMCS